MWCRGVECVSVTFCEYSYLGAVLVMFIDVLMLLNCCSIVSWVICNVAVFWSGCAAAFGAVLSLIVRYLLV